MKKLLIIIIVPLLYVVLFNIKEAKSSRVNSEREKATEELLVKNAVESRKYIIKLERLYSNHGAILILYQERIILLLMETELL